MRDGDFSNGDNKLYNQDMQKLYFPELFIPTGEVVLLLENVVTKKRDIQYVKNLVTTAGKSSIADRLRGATKGEITYCALGTNATAPALADVALGTELFRKQISVRSVSGNVATFQTFYTTAEANGTLKEAGLFGDDATGVANSGTLFCHTAIDRVKSTNDTLTILWALTVG